MCVLVYIPVGKKLPQDKIAQMHDNNPDGFGIAYTKNGDLTYKKGVFNLQKILAIYKKIENYETFKVLHFRTASSGGVSAVNAHPFFINRECLFAFNGNFFHFSKYFQDNALCKMADSQIFLTEFLKKLPVDFIYNKKIMGKIEQYCKLNFTKMIFATKEKVTILNENAGYWQNGIWYSNGGLDNYFGYGFSGAYYYKATDIRHLGGLLSANYLGYDKQPRWYSCHCCKGHFKYKNLNLIGGYCKSCVVYYKLKELIK